MSCSSSVNSRVAQDSVSFQLDLLRRNSLTVTNIATSLYWKSMQEPPSENDLDTKLKCEFVVSNRTDMGLSLFLVPAGFH